MVMATFSTNNVNKNTKKIKYFGQFEISCIYKKMLKTTIVNLINSLINGTLRSDYKIHGMTRSTN